MRFAGLVEWEPSADRDLQLAGRGQLKQLRQARPQHLWWQQRQQRETPERLVAADHGFQFGSREPVAAECCKNQLAARRQSLQRQRRQRAADRVVDDVGALPVGGVADMCGQSDCV